MNKENTGKEYRQRRCLWKLLLRRGVCLTLSLAVAWKCSSAQAQLADFDLAIDHILATAPGKPEQPQQVDVAGFDFVIDPTIEPIPATVSGRPDQPPRRVAVVENPGGGRDQLVEDEVILLPNSPQELEDFLGRYRGVVINDGALPPLPPQIADDQRREMPPSGYVLIRVDLTALTVDTQRFVAAMWELGLRGTFRFSSEGAVKLTALLAEARPTPAPTPPSPSDS